MKTNTGVNILIVSLLSIAFGLMLYIAVPHGHVAIFSTLCAIIVASLFFHTLSSYDSMFNMK